MAEVRFKVYWKAKVEGTCTVGVERDEGESIDDLKHQAEEKAQELVQEELNVQNNDVDVDNVDVDTDEVELCKCRECGGRKYKIAVLEGGAGLIKVGPCPACQRIPTTLDVCEHVMKLLKDIPTDEEEE